VDGDVLVGVVSGRDLLAEEHAVIASAMEMAQPSIGPGRAGSERIST
jgi:hypothetical protein